MKQLLAITASVAILAVAAPFAASQWIEFSARNTTWRTAADLKNFENEQAYANIRDQQKLSRGEIFDDIDVKRWVLKHSGIDQSGYSDEQIRALTDEQIMRFARQGAPPNK
jgi:hypothetical protein